MARLETQINQIYLTDTESKKSSLVLYEEQISNSAHLFVLAQLQDMLRKTETNELKKISEIILESFRANKKMAAENLFESALSQINQNLADLAHSGKKAWVGKFSALIALKSGEKIFAANNGSTSAWLKRDDKLIEILPSEKRGIHPLKTFTNFTEGKLQAKDELIMTTSNVFNYISFELFQKILTKSDAAMATNEISGVLKDSVDQDQAFCAFFLAFDKKSASPASEMPAAPIPAPTSIYAPLPEEIEQEPVREKLKIKLPALPHISMPFSLPSFSIPRLSFPAMPKLKKFEWHYFQNLSAAGKFFFISAMIFSLLFLANLAIYGMRSHANKTAERIDSLVAQINTELTEAQSALIYRDDETALNQVAAAQANFEELKELSPLKAQGLADKIEAVKNQVNKVSVVVEPKVEIELPHRPVYLSRATNSYLLSGTDSNSISAYNTAVSDYFMLNSFDSKIIGVSFWQPAGVVVATSNKIYHINNTLKQFEEIVGFVDNEIDAIKTQNGNLYVHDGKNDQIMRIATSRNGYTLSGITKTGPDLRDFGMDKDIYLLYPDKIHKISGGAVLAFPYPTMTDPISNATKIFVGSNIYILEPTKNRLVILTKNGLLQNQIYFPNAAGLTDFHVDEAGRFILLLDSGKLLRIAF